MVLSLTIGFGDYTPVTDAARVIWIVYALMAVPIVTNFAVQTVGGIVSLTSRTWRITDSQMHTWSEHRFTRKRFEMERERDPEVFAPHSHFILRHHEEWDDMRDKYLLARDKAFAALYSLGHVVQEVEGVDAEGCDSADASSPKTESVSETKSESEPKSKPQPQPKRAASGSRPQLAPLHITSSIALSLQPPSTRLSPSSSISPGAQRLRKALHLTKAQKEVIGEMLDNPETHEEVVENLGYPEVVDADGSQGAGTTTTDADPETGLLTGTSLENPGDTSPSDRASSSTSTRVDPSYRRKPDDTCQAFKDTSVGVHRHKPAGSPTKSLDPPFVASVEPTEWTPNHRALQDCIPGMGPRLIQKGENGEEETKVQLTGDPMVDSHRLELYLIKELVDRVTRLEAQSRQMLIDCMDRDVARTLLLADRNLQVRDAFQLYGNKIDLERTYKEEAEQTREDYEKRRAEERKEVDRQAAVIDDLHGQDEDMLTRVRRYRNTFAEVLVLSSTLLKLEGDELKRFERWHVGDLRRNRTEVEHATVAVAQRKRKRKRDHVGGGLDKFIDWATAKPERTPRPEEPHVSDRKRIANFGRQVIGSFGRLTHHWGDSGDYSPGIPPPRALRKDGDEDGSPAAGTADVDPNADPDENDLDRLSDRLDDAEDEQAEVDAEVAADLEAQDETRHRGDTYVPFRGMRLRVPTDDDDEVTHRARPTASPEDSPEGSPRGWPTKKSKKHSLLSVVHRASASGPSASASGPQDSTSTAYPPHPASLSDKVKTTAKKTTHHLKERAMTRAANRIVADTDEEAIYLTNRFGQSIRHKYAGTSAMGNVPSDSGSAASPGVTSVSDLKGSTSASASAPPSAATSPGIDPHKHSHGHIHADGSQSTPGSWDPRRRHIRSRSGRHEGSGWLAHSTDAEVEVTERELAELASHQHTAHKPDPAFKRPEAHAQARLGAATLGKIAQSYAGFETYLGQRRDETRKERTQEEERRATARLEHLLAKEREKGRKEGREEKEREKNGDTGDGEEGGWR
jgi:hypothetical protein